MAAVRAAGQVALTGRSYPVNAPDFDPDQVADAALELSHLLDVPLDIGLGVYVWNDAYVHQILAYLRREGFTGRIILGGPQISYTGQGLEALYPEADVFIRGYGEEALTAVTATGERIDQEGVHWAGELDRCLQAKVDLERLPSPLLTGEIDLSGGQRFIRWETQRGCPYRCSFCQHREAGARLKHRELDSARLRQEIALFARSSVDDIAVLDPIFNIGAIYLDVLHAFREIRFAGRLSLQCRFEAVDEAFLEACAGLNVRPEFGLQTIHPIEGRAINRPNRLEKVETVIAQLHARSIPFEVSIIFGLPEQTLASFRETVDFCLRQRIPVVKAFPLMLLRGTELERDRARWALEENDDPIPAVVSSSSFDAWDWGQMARLADALTRTEWAHPADVQQLEASILERLELRDRWSPVRQVRGTPRVASLQV